MITATNATTFTAAVQHGLTRAPIVTLGGQDAGKFAPNINMGFSFKGEREERFINLNRIDKAASTSIEKCTGGIIVDKTDQYLIDAAGNLKWNIILPEKPKSPRIRLKVDFSDGTEFLPQGTLEDDWAADHEGLSLEAYLAANTRPIDIVDSLAVYINKAHNQYKTGKVGHWKRIICYDKAGNIGYGKYERVSRNQIDIVLDEKYLEAVDAKNLWPVLVDPTIGYTTGGGTARAGNYLAVSYYSVTMPENGTLSKLYSYHKNNGGAHTIKQGLYNDSSGNPTTLFAGPTEVSVDVAAATWFSTSQSGSLVSGTLYYPACCWPSNGHMHYDSADSTQAKYNSTNDMPASPTVSAQSRYWSVYAEYTASGGVADLTASASTITKAESDVTLFLAMSDSTIASISAASGDMDLTLALAGVADNISAAAATLQQYMALSGESDTKSSASSDVDLYLKLVALSDSISAAVGSLSVSGPENITGTIETISAALGALTLIAQTIAGTVAGRIGQQFIKGAIGEQKITGEIGEQFIKGSIN